MALVVGELTAYLTVNKDGWRRGLNEAEGDLNRLARGAGQAADRIDGRSGLMVQTVSRSMAQVSVNADREGRAAGGKLSQGIQQGIIRNSPLIVAAVGGALTLGAPLMTAAATTLFGGIGAIAAAQSNDVQDAWSELWQQVSAGAQQEARVLVPVFENMAGRIGQSFERLRPQLGAAFEAVAPQIDIVADSLLGLTERAMPGLLKTVEAAGPTIAGLGGLLLSVGDGLNGFFSNISGHTSAAGQVFSLVGDALEDLLPLLGELLGQGTELAAAVLPPLVTVLSGVANGLEFIGPLLPAIVAGFVGFKVVGVASAALATFAQRLAFASYGSGAFANTAGRMHGVVAGLGRVIGAAGVAFPLLAAGAILVSTQLSRAEQKAKDWGQALLEGGEAAENAWAAAEAGSRTVDTWSQRIPILGGIIDAFTADTEDASHAANDLYQAMSPLGQAQADVTHWTNELSHAFQTGDETLRNRSGVIRTVAEASQELAEAQIRVAEEEAALERAATGMTVSFEDAASAASQLQSALDALNGGQLSLNEANRAFERSIDNAQASLAEYGRNLDITTEAGNKNSEALDGIAEAGNNAADALYRQTGDWGQFTQAMIHARNVTYDQARAFGKTHEEALAYVETVLRMPTEQNLDVSINAQEAAAELGRVAEALEGVPDGHEVDVGVISEPAILLLDQLGYEVRALPGGRVEITADDQATPITRDVLTQLGLVNGTETVPTIGGNAEPFWVAVNNIEGGLIGLDAATANPQILADGTFFGEVADYAERELANLDGATATPTVGADPGPFNAAVEQVLQGVGIVDGQTPTPVVGADPGPFNGVYNSIMAAVSIVAGQTPTPVANMNAFPLLHEVDQAIAAAGLLGAQRPTPVASLTDYVSAAAGRVRDAILGIPLSRHVTITQTIRQVGSLIGGSTQGWGWGAATGGSVDAFMAMAQRRDGGGPVAGPGGPTDDLIPALLGGRVPFRLSNGEHVLDARDVQLMGGQAGVYQFRELLNAGKLPAVQVRASGGAVGTQAVVSHGQDFDYDRLARAITSRERPNISVATGPDARAIAREIEWRERQRDALAPAWP